MKFRTSNNATNLDSFLDIITNVIGVLVLIACAIALQIKNYEPPRHTPTMRSPPKDMTFTYFVCGKQRCRRIQHPRTKLYPAVKKTALDQLGDSPSWKEFISHCNKRDDWDPEFDIELKRHSNEIVDAHIRLKEKDEDSIKYIRSELASLESGSNGIFFYVHSDSFDAFRQARSLAKELGFRVGWEPVGKDYLCYTVENPRGIRLYSNPKEIESAQ